MTIAIEPRGFADDAVASVSGRFPLGSPAGTAASTDIPSPIGLRPWGLRRLSDTRAVTPSAFIVQYDPVQQVGVGPDGTVAVRILAGGPPTADTTSTVDGEDPPSAEDWNNDFHEGGPFQV